MLLETAASSAVFGVCMGHQEDGIQAAPRKDQQDRKGYEEHYQQYRYECKEDRSSGGPTAINDNSNISNETLHMGSSS